MVTSHCFGSGELLQHENARPLRGRRGRLFLNPRFFLPFSSFLVFSHLLVHVTMQGHRNNLQGEEGGLPQGADEDCGCNPGGQEDGAVMDAPSPQHSNLKIVQNCKATLGTGTGASWWPPVSGICPDLMTSLDYPGISWNSVYIHYAIIDSLSLLLAARSPLPETPTSLATELVEIDRDKLPFPVRSGCSPECRHLITAL